jgi:predicted nucleic acid-binding protein
VKTWLIDTGPLVAYLDRDDPAHEQVVEILDDFAGQLVTSSAVLTEAMHFVASNPRGPRLLAEFVAASGLRILDACQPTELHEAVSLMEKYADTPMDFADATLVLLAEGLDVHDVLTLDRRGFTVYRTRQKQHLWLVLDPS